MNQVKTIRARLGVTQQALGHGIGCTQANIGHYERGQMLSPDMARKLIEFCALRGLVITYDHVYGAKPLPACTQFQEAAAHALEVAHV